MFGLFDYIDYFGKCLFTVTKQKRVEKISHRFGIRTVCPSADNKGGVPVYVLPTDVLERTKTEPPYSIDRDLCRRCEACEPKEACPKGAIDGQIDLLKCDGCGICRDLCPYGAISRAPITVVTRPLDKENIERLRSIPGFVVLEGPEEIEGLV